MQSTQAHSRGGWSPQETEMLWQEVRNVSSNGEPLRAAFDRTARQTGRQPNSIRNYYYQSLKNQQAPEELCTMRTQPFVPFDEQEVDWLLRQILKDRARGISVRACVQRLGNGERTLALRYQNKYRSILKSHPDMIQRAIDELAQEGIQCPNPYNTLRMRRKQQEAENASVHTGTGDDEDTDTLANLVRALREAMGQERNEEMRRREQMDRLNVRCDLLRLELARRDEKLIQLQQQEQNMHTALAKAAGLMEICKEFLSMEDLSQAAQDEAMRFRLSSEVSGLESALS